MLCENCKEQIHSCKMNKANTYEKCKLQHTELREEFNNIIHVTMGKQSNIFLKT